MQTKVTLSAAIAMYCLAVGRKLPMAFPNISGSFSSSD